METRHRVVVGDARGLAAVEDDAVELVVTSPPYPMIEMWDDLFAELDPEIGDLLDAGAGEAAFEAMHAVLDDVWADLSRVLVEGGIACINVGDATRTLDGRFRVYQNHSRIVDALTEQGFDPLPEILWRKPTNSAAKFMGSGMVPPNAYVTLEHEYVLVFRNGPRRSFDPGADRRYEAAYFWEERNDWFSDLWTDVTGDRQALDADDVRERSGAYPFEIPYRLISMYSAYGDTVLDPFLGTGTTTLAAMVASRNSAGYEIDPALVDRLADDLDRVPALSRTVARDRLADHRAFVERVRDRGESLAYDAEYYDLPVRTKQERRLRLYAVSAVERLADEPELTDDRHSVPTADQRATDDPQTVYCATHEPVESVPFDSERTRGDDAEDS
jgi:DNA modification methylase